jgi:hypothetical protein
MVIMVMMIMRLGMFTILLAVILIYSKIEINGSTTRITGNPIEIAPGIPSWQLGERISQDDLTSKA